MHLVKDRPALGLDQDRRTAIEGHHLIEFDFKRLLALRKPHFKPEARTDPARGCHDGTHGIAGMGVQPHMLRADEDPDRAFGHLARGDVLSQH